VVQPGMSILLAINEFDVLAIALATDVVDISF
jgi:hypothetical protein